MVAAPFWFGPSSRPLFGWLHLPADGRVTGGAVLCPPLGIEAICSYFTYRTLADRLAEAGVAVLRFDYDGTGDSVGSQEDEGRTDAWLASVETALAWLRRSGVPRVGMVGMRMGALFAATVAARHRDLDALVLWDPCVSGRSFLREQRAFRMLSLGGEDGDGSVDGPGIRFSPETVASLSPLDITTTDGPLALRLLVLQHPERGPSRPLARRLEATNVEWAEATGQGALLDPPLQETPEVAIDRVTRWLAAVLDGEKAFVAGPETGPAVVGSTLSGDEIVERPLSLGPSGLFGILTEVRGGAGGPTVVFVDEGNTPHIGQSRLWVELSRTLAASGLRALRFDLSGNGDSGVRPGQQAHVVRAPEAFEDVDEAVRAISPDDPTDVVLVGLCSGAYQAVEYALADPVKGVCVINPALSFIPPEGTSVRGTHRRARQGTRQWALALSRRTVDSLARRKAPHVAHRWNEALEAGYWPSAVAARRPDIPQFVWRGVNLLLLANPAAATLEKLGRTGVDTLLVCGDADLFPISLGSGRTLRRLRRSDLFSLQLVEGLDHAVLMVEHRERLKRVLTDYIVERWRPVGSGASMPRSTAPSSRL